MNVADMNNMWHVFVDDRNLGAIGFVEEELGLTLRFKSIKSESDIDNSRVKALFYSLCCAEEFLLTAKDYSDISEHVALRLPKLALVFGAARDPAYVNGSIIFLCLTIVKRLKHIWRRRG